MKKATTGTLSSAVGVLLVWWIGSLVWPSAFPPIWSTITSIFSSQSSTSGPLGLSQPAPVQRTGDMHICTFAHFDQAENKCLRDDSTLPLIDNTAVMILPDSDPGLQLLGQRKDGTGQWATAGVDGNGFDGLTRWTDAQGNLRKTIDYVEVDSGFNPDCGETVRFKAEDSNHKTVGTDIITFTCGGM